MSIDDIPSESPASDELLAALTAAARKLREHELQHDAAWPDELCLNLTTYMGRHMAAVLMRLRQSETELVRMRAEQSFVRLQGYGAVWTGTFVQVRLPGELLTVEEAGLLHQGLMESLVLAGHLRPRYVTAEQLAQFPTEPNIDDELDAAD
ncbi:MULTISPECIES: hypothetical protein [unclassified Nonomuraea]|uniref:hypothetical protein n=1 Tax=unclassified Nonomuraea TaxID=2593643 RepID=UPI0033C2BE22